MAWIANVSWFLGALLCIRKWKHDCPQACAAVEFVPLSTHVWKAQNFTELRNQFLGEMACKRASAELFQSVLCGEAGLCSGCVKLRVATLIVKAFVPGLAKLTYCRNKPLCGGI